MLHLLCRQGKFFFLIFKIIYKKFIYILLSNVQIQHNCFGNPNADYEIGTELIEHAKYIDASQNSWGDVNPQNFMPKIFDQVLNYYK